MVLEKQFSTDIPPVASEPTAGGLTDAGEGSFVLADDDSADSTCPPSSLVCSS